MNVLEIASRSGWQIAAEVNTQNTIKGIFTGDLLSWVMGHAQPDDLWVTVQAHSNIIAVAVLRELAGIVIAHGSMIEEDTLKTAREEGIPILLSSQSSADCIKILAGYGL
ncbi:MAG: AraC family transcriptional regulator [Erysipelotrichales bacterium]|nr:MAG: AraC family transcriptional regulator [Erysipelotrichales bacterium]